MLPNQFFVISFINVKYSFADYLALFLHYVFTFGTNCLQNFLRSFPSVVQVAFWDTSSTLHFAADKKFFHENDTPFYMG